ncbi:Retrovirus-related Pol polyprotein from transposon opus [Gossypium australe]|uniref:Retrovirus-related Pol polyprotein from transposon opus n=1 Tax=Gossypium australe TaxID=47621 RepID=A0A5B6VLY4_9ROSI|nr:Retrovirus-related Pol polyprotein from transposon opus [Gossypium australe]
MEMISYMQRQFGIGIPSNTENNPHKDGKEHVNAIALWSGKILNNTSAIISKKMPSKLKDPSSFTISIEIGDIYFSKAFCDLGANINLMPLSIYRKLRVGDLKNTSITLPLAGRSLVHQKGKLEDVLVKVRNFIVPTWTLEDQEIPILSGRKFLAMSRSTIDLEKMS